jgi:hypothetical protein
MGLLDVLNGVQDGPGAQRASGSASGGMSPLTMALLGLMRTRPSRVSAAGNQAPARPNLVLHRPRIPARPALKPGAPLAICSRASSAAAPLGAFCGMPQRTATQRL